MYRVNQIIKTISKMNAYAPYNQINKKATYLERSKYIHFSHLSFLLF